MGLLDVLNAISGVSSAAGASQANNRRLGNEFADSRGRTLANLYGTQVGAQTNTYTNQANNQTAQYNAQQDAITQALLGSSREAAANAAIDLDRRKFALDAPNTRATQATRGSLLQSLMPATISGGSSRLQAHTPTISGGFNAPLGPGAREAGRLLEGTALQGLRSGDTFDPLQRTDFQGGVMKPPGILAAPNAIAAPTLPDYQGPSSMESILGALGALGAKKGPSLLDALKGLFKGGGGGSGIPDGYGQGPEWGNFGTAPPVTGETGGSFYVSDPDFQDTSGQGPEWGNFGGPDTSGSAGDLNGYWDGTQWVSGF